MSEDEWKVAGQLQDMSKVSEHFEHVVSPCVHASLFACTDSQRHYIVLLLCHKSGSGYTPAMDFIDQTLTTQSLNHTHFEPTIHVSLQLAKKTLNHYYPMTDMSEVYRIVMGMWSMILFCQTCLLTVLPATNVQYSIPVTSFRISKMRGGSWTGSKWQTPSYCYIL